MKKYSIIAVIIILLAGAIFAGNYIYNTRLTRSKEEGKNIASRAIPKAETESTTVAIPAPDVLSGTSGTVIKENPKVETTKKILKTGSFVTLDPAHYAKGGVDIVEAGDNVNITLKNDFATNPDGPDLYVWLVKKQTIKNVAVGGVSSKAGDYVDLGPLQAKSGLQSYQVTKAEFGSNDYAVVIWCRAFNIQFSNAILSQI
jgi:hypothetical protein